MAASEPFRGLSILCQSILVVACVGGCAGREPIGQFSEQQVAPFSETGLASTASGLAPTADRWWTSLGDPQLNARVEQAFQGNYDLAAALQRVSAARSLARRQASDLFPDVNGFVQGQSVFGPGEDRFPSDIGLDLSYQVDLWGRIESRVQAERFRASATHSDYQAVALLLAAEVTRTWLALIEANAQLKLLDDQIETNRTGLELQELRFVRGLVRSPDVLRQRQLLESTFEQSAVVQSNVEVLEHQLAILLGELPQLADYDPGTELPELPPLPPTGLPSDLLKRRPDVRRDYLAFVAADRDLAAAVSDQFPRLNLSGSIVNAAENPENLFRDWFASIGSQLIAPLFDGGQRRAEVDRTKALTRLRFNEYGQTMLIAFGEVEDALAREKYQVKRLKHLKSQVELARQSSDQLREQYLIGDEDYLAVLTAITAWQRLQRETLSAELELRVIRVSLYLALAGGFDPRNPPLSTELVTIVAESSVEDEDFDETESIPTADAEPDTVKSEREEPNRLNPIDATMEFDQNELPRPVRLPLPQPISLTQPLPP